MHTPYWVHLSLLDPINLNVCIWRWAEKLLVKQFPPSNYFFSLTSKYSFHNAPFLNTPICYLDSKTNTNSEIKLLRLHSNRNDTPHVEKICSIRKESWTDDVKIGVGKAYYWTKRHCCRFSPSTSVSPANHSTNFSIIIIVRGWHNRLLVAAVPSRPNWTPPPTTPIFFFFFVYTLLAIRYIQSLSQCAGLCTMRNR
jgi:hypothetical protein